MYINNNPYLYKEHEDRQFLFPFLVGAGIGGAAVGLTRPRPIYNVAPNPYPPYPPYRPYGGGYYYNYGYNSPYYR